MIGLVTRDMAASLTFYRHLGLEFPPGAETEPHVEAVLPGGMRMGWDTVEMVRTLDPDWVPPQGGPAGALAFLCDSPAEVDATYALLTEAGYLGEHAPWDAFWGQRYASVRDPDDNAVDLFAPLAEAPPEE